ncbi:Branched-chain alpha-ketoacid dehydrogenase kinase [Metarhizium rileyi]|uniref:Branched-chain alpha-ketoacid dehydrogenase kinase n=1 Tax=Metarhizium rileyi (strain RCEF 4871) TaxID=1649241 RepID=A0A167KP85_METRR|nr:Branched-chain alpha-ketoacid dehydrogenase kinase [Metarhizium rileyi RCEF 4871]
MFSMALCKTGKRCRPGRAAVLAAARGAVACASSSPPSRFCPRHGRPQLSRRASNGPWRPVSVLDEWVAREARPISLRQLMVFGRSLTESRLISSANYVRTELPARQVAHNP